MSTAGLSTRFKFGVQDDRELVFANVTRKNVQANQGIPRSLACAVDRKLVYRHRPNRLACGAYNSDEFATRFIEVDLCLEELLKFCGCFCYHLVRVPDAVIPVLREANDARLLEQGNNPVILFLFEASLCLLNEARILLIWALSNRALQGLQMTI